MDDPANKLRVALIGCSGLLGDIIRQTLTREPDVDVVAQLDAGETDMDPSRLDTDIVLWNEADEVRILLWLRGMSHRCAPRVLATLGDGHRAALWELTPQRTELGELSPISLVRNLRAAKHASRS